MPNIAQQDYIIIDWEGKDSSDAAKKAEVDAILKNLYLANPLALLSVVFKNLSIDGYEENMACITSFALSGNAVECLFPDVANASLETYTFDID